MVDLDANPQLLAWGRAQAKDADLAERIQFQEGDVLNLPFEDGRFDLVWCSRVVHGLSNQLAGVRELRRVLRPGGRLFLREAGLPLQFLPFDVGLGDAGLENRLGNARSQRFVHWRGSLPDGVSYPYGWSHMLHDAGFNQITAKSFLLEFASPLEKYQIGYLQAWLSHDFNDPNFKQLLTAKDISTLEQLLNPTSTDYVFNRDDLHGALVDTVYAGCA